MRHANAPLTVEGRHRLLERCRTRPIAHVAAEMGVRARIADLRRIQKWSASRIAFELQAQGITVSRRTVTRHLARLGLNHRKFIDPNGEQNRKPRRISARWPGHMVHVDVKKVGRIPDRLCHREPAPDVVGFGHQLVINRAKMSMRFSTTSAQAKPGPKIACGGGQFVFCSGLGSNGTVVGVKH